MLTEAQVAYCMRKRVPFVGWMLTNIVNTYYILRIRSTYNGNSSEN